VLAIWKLRPYLEDLGRAVGNESDTDAALAGAMEELKRADPWLEEVSLTLHTNLDRATQPPRIDGAPSLVYEDIERRANVAKQPFGLQVECRPDSIFEQFAVDTQGN
jgi:hypothetical protein